MTTTAVEPTTFAALRNALRLLGPEPDSSAALAQTLGLRPLPHSNNLVAPKGVPTPLAEQLATFGDAIDVSFWDNSYSPGWFWVSVHDRRATKDRAVRMLLDHAGLGDVEIVAFGDQANDIAMLRAAHRGIAVANAIAEVRAVADEIIGPNSDDSVPQYVQADWRNRR